MFELMIEDHFDSAHFLYGYDGECENMHGHQFKVHVYIKGEVLDNVGMLVDFKIIKNNLQKVISELDHKILNDVLDFNPSSELIAKFIFNELERSFINGIILDRVAVWETPSARAVYSKV